MKWINKKEFGNFYVEQLESNNDIYLLTMNDNENKFNDNNIKYLNQSFDYVESCKNAKCLITTSNSKYYSLGFDLKYFKPLGKERFENGVHEYQLLLNKILTFTIPTISCINGHAYAAGAIFSLAHDYRIMKDDKGFFTIPEIDHGIPLTQGSIELIKSKISNKNIFRDVVFGKRFSGKEASNFNLVDLSCQNILEESLNLADKYFKKGKDRISLKEIKLGMYKQASYDLVNKNLGKVGVNFSKL